jgi:hypothetical protein
MRGIPFARPNNQKAPAAPPCHSPVLGGSAFEKSAAAGQIEFFFVVYSSKKMQDSSPFLYSFMFIHHDQMEPRA